MSILCGSRCVWMLVAGEALVFVPVWCMDVCRNVDSFPFRQIFALPIRPTFRRGHAEFFRSMYTFRRGTVHECVCKCCGSNFLFYVYHWQATMVLSMSSARISRYKKDAKADMIRRNRSQIRCPCRSCKLLRWINPDSGQLEEHLFRRGFMDDYNQAPTANGAHEDEGERVDEESPGHDYHDEGDVSREDHHDEGDAGGEDDEAEDGGGESPNTETPVPRSAFQDIHVQELLHKQTSNARAAEREKAKLAQMKKDGMTPLFPGCRPQDTRLQVTLDALEMKSNNKWTDLSFS